jgi:hypothetical protein
VEWSGVKGREGGIGVEASISWALESMAGQADHLRAWVLKITMRVPGFRAVFCHRAWRLGALFFGACGFFLGTSLFFPLWVLAIGPAVYGVPHLFSSLRYFHYAVEGRGAPAESSARFTAFGVIALIMLGVFAYRFVVTLNFLGLPVAHLSEWRGSTYLELGATVAAFVVGMAIYRKPMGQILRGALLIGPLAAGFWLRPAWTVGFLVLAHNFVAFVYWWLAAKTRAEKGVALGSGLMVFGITVLIFMGRLDGIYQWRQPVDTLSFASLSFEGLGQLITPWSENPSWWLHAAVAYAFGQAMHYFVWLKAIPDQHHQSEMPTSFRQSWRLFEADFGRAWAARIVALILVSVGVWGSLHFAQARNIYFCLAAYHGYLEIAGLALVGAGVSLRELQVGLPRNQS